MISRSVLKSAGYSKHVLGEQAEYYSGEPVPSGWFGKGAEAMGLKGPVEAEAFDRLLAGIVRERDEDGRWRERQMVGKFDKEKGEFTRKSGFDFTVEAPKSVSVEALVHGNKDALEAFEKASLAAMKVFEAECRARVKGSEVEAGMVGAWFDHIASRAGQEHLHRHFAVLNMAEVDGKMYALAEREMFRARRLADHVFHNELGNELRARGFAVQHDAEGRVEIEGYTRETLEERSRRRQQIKEELSSAGLSIEKDRGAAEAARAKTAGKKFVRESARDEMQSRWQAEHAPLGAERGVQTPEIAAEAKAEDRAARAREAVAAAIDHLTEREMVQDAKKLRVEALKFAGDKTGFSEIKAEIERLRASGELIIGRPPREDGRPGGVEIFTTRSLLELEKSNQDKVRGGRQQHEAVMTLPEFSVALEKFESRKGFSLSAEQRAAARMILVGGDRFQVVQGAAGTGKTTMLEFVREAAESRGWKVTGHSNGSEQAQKMEEESGIKTTTTAAHLIDARKQIQEEGARPEGAPPVRELRIMDEASMAGTKQMRDVISTTEQSGARSVFLGDKLQHQSVEAGRAFEQLQERIRGEAAKDDEKAQAHAPVAVLGKDSIRRQKTDTLREAVSLILDKKEKEAIDALDRAGKVTEVGDAQRAAQPKIEALRAKADESAKSGDAEKATELREKARTLAKTARADDNKAAIGAIAKMQAGLAPDARRLILTATNSDRLALNEAVRAELKKTGEIHGPQRSHDALRSVDITGAQAKRAQFYEAGWIVETARDTKIAARGAQFEVLRVDSRMNHLIVKGADGNELRVDPKRIAVQAFEKDRPVLQAGDRIRWTQNHMLPGTDVRVRNGQQATVERIDEQGTHVRIGEGTKAQRVTFAPEAAIKATHAYASTSHAAQGKTQNAIIHHNPDAGKHGARESYVNVTRAVDDIHIFTSSKNLLRDSAGAEQNKTAAMDLERDRKAAREAFAKDLAAMAATNPRSMPTMAELEAKRQAEAEAQRQAELAAQKQKPGRDFDHSR
ncbi:putative ATP-dependent exoDNAse (Exonuclease V), alpha subunit-helicase superfamily I member [Burkholderiales bacterium GJ-E10]|nr:putative ATP-dependent exoDNAse (Exonuclease V), alpha subunit-helicase superfamily I member [Burkholderiales bacterium GJ-E10]